MQKINSKLIYFISGMPGNGKTYLSHYLNTLYKHSVIIHLDSVLEHYINKNNPEYILHLADIYSFYQNMESINESLREDVRAYTIQYIQKELLNNNSNVLLIEGFNATAYSGLMSIMLSGNEVVDVHCLKTNNGYRYLVKKDTHYNYKQLHGRIRVNTLQKLFKRTTYQCFEDLGQSKNNSDTMTKLNSMSVIDKVSGKSYLDIGCNTGYFVIQAALNGAKSAIGIDADLPSLQTASMYKNCIYELLNVDFIHADIFCYVTDQKFDFITCASAFHYFREKQRVFIDIVYGLLNPGGIFSLEAGIIDINANEIYVHKYSRSIDTEPCYYPNEKTLIGYAKKFELLHVNNSVKQSGDEILRKVYIFKKT